MGVSFKTPCLPWDFLSNDGWMAPEGAGGTTSKSLVDLEEGDGKIPHDCLHVKNGGLVSLVWDPGYFRKTYR